MPFHCGKRSAGICVVLGPKTSSTYSSEYPSGFFEPAASHLHTSPSPRKEGLLGQAPRDPDSMPGFIGELVNFFCRPIRFNSHLGRGITNVCIGLRSLPSPSSSEGLLAAMVEQKDRPPGGRRSGIASLKGAFISWTVSPYPSC
jgi:hypothetical protein